MSRRFFSARLFSLTSGLGYATAVFFNLPLFRYHPQINRFTFGHLAVRPPGPQMQWYGWIASAVVVALLITAIVPKRIGDRIPFAAFYLLVPIMIAVAINNEAKVFVGQ